MRIINGVITIKNSNAKGRKHFQVKYIRWSYRIRGIVARIQMNNMEMNKVFITSHIFVKRGTKDLEKITAVNKLIAKMFMYSAIKIRANGPLPYSILKPDTSSDSPSAKSKGVRFVSARLVINHRIAVGSIRIRIQDIISKDIIVIFSEEIEYSLAIRIKDILTSYDTV